MIDEPMKKSPSIDFMTVKSKVPKYPLFEDTLNLYS